MSAKKKNALAVKMGSLCVSGAVGVAAPDMTPVEWYHKKSHTSGVFNALTKEWIFNVPARLLAPQAARMAVFHQIVAAVGGEAVAADDKLFRRALRCIKPQIPINMLEHPEDFGFGREIVCDPGHVGNILSTFDPSLQNEPMLIIWRVWDEAGNVVDVHFILYDGWHTSRVSIEQEYKDHPEDLWHGRNMISIPVSNVKPIHIVEEAAAAFAGVNEGKYKKKTSSRDDWRHRVLQKDPAAMRVVRIAAECGLNAECLPKSKGYPNLGPARIVEKLLYGADGINAFDYVTEADVRRTLTLISDKTNIGLFRRFTEAKGVNFIAGLCLFNTFVERPGFAHAIGVHYMLSLPDFFDSMERIRRNLTENKMIDALRPFVPADALKYTRDEQKRYLFAAAQLILYYKELVAAPKSKRQVWSACPIECKRLFHESLTIKDEFDRRNFMAEQQKALSKLKNMPKAYCSASRALGKPLTR